MYEAPTCTPNPNDYPMRVPAFIRSGEPATPRLLKRNFYYSPLCMQDVEINKQIPRSGIPSHPCHA